MPCRCLQKLTAFSLDDFVAGKSKVWTFWDCAPSEFPWTYSKDEYAYVLAGQFYVTYEGELEQLQLFPLKLQSSKHFQHYGPDCKV